MDSGIIYLVTLYNKGGRRCGLFLTDELERAEEDAKSHINYFGNLAKIWECKEVKSLRRASNDIIQNAR